jgi:hypothetical protein
MSKYNKDWWEAFRYAEVDMILNLNQEKEY